MNHDNLFFFVFTFQAYLSKIWYSKTRNDILKGFDVQIDTLKSDKTVVLNLIYAIISSLKDHLKKIFRCITDRFYIYGLL